MDDATINLWLDQAERDEVISPGFRPHVERKLLAPHRPSRRSGGPARFACRKAAAQGQDVHRRSRGRALLLIRLRLDSQAREAQRALDC